MFKEKSRGFTLIELLVVIAIIGILSSVVLASLNSAREKSRDARRLSDVKQLQLALELFFDSNGAYPSSTSALAPDFIGSVPVDPVSDDPYDYETGSSNTDYVLRSTLEQLDHQALGDDVDGTPLSSIDCDDADQSATTPYYCVTP